MKFDANKMHEATEGQNEVSQKEEVMREAYKRAKAVVLKMIDRVAQTNEFVVSGQVEWCNLTRNTFPWKTDEEFRGILKDLKSSVFANPQQFDEDGFVYTMSLQGDEQKLTYRFNDPLANLNTEQIQKLSNELYHEGRGALIGFKYDYGEYGGYGETLHYVSNERHDELRDKQNLKKMNSIKGRVIKLFGSQPKQLSSGDVIYTY